MRYIYIIYTTIILLLLVNSTIIAKETTTYTDQEIGFNKSRLSERLIERGISGEALTQELTFIREQYVQYYIEDLQRQEEQQRIEAEFIVRQINLQPSRRTAFSPKATVTCDVSAVERQALIDLYNATDGANWRVKWDLTKTVCEWPGVGVIDGKVTSIYLLSNSLNGELPDSLGDLVNLTSVVIARNGNLTGNIPSTIANWSKVESIDLHSNRLTGEIPSGLGNLITLKFLYLFRNSLSGSIPESMGQLENLERINLSSNRLSGEISASFASLSKLKSLNLFENALTGAIPSELGDLINLEGLNLARNGLTGSIPSSLGKLTKLISLYLNANRLTGSIPEELGELSKLEGLNLFRNSLSGIIPDSFGGLSNLLLLSIEENRMSGTIPVSLGNLSKLKHLYLSRNTLTGSIPRELGELTNLNSLGLSYNNLSGVIPAELGQLINLIGLGLNNNNLSGTLPPELSKMSSLLRLHLQMNKISGNIPPSYENLPAISQLILSHNRLSGNIPTKFKERENLQYLYIQENQFVFSDIEKELIELRNKLVNFSFVPQADINEEETINATEGFNYTISVTGLTSPNNQYQWYKDDTVITGATSPTYTITKATAEDAGVYNCLITNTVVEGLTLRRRPITLVVNPIDPTFLGDCTECKSFKPEAGQYVISGWVKEEQPEQVISYTNTAIGINLTDHTNTTTSQTFTPSGNIIDGWQRITGKFTVPDTTIHLGIELINENRDTNNGDEYDQYFDIVPEAGTPPVTTGYELQYIGVLSNCENTIGSTYSANIYSTYYLEVGKIYKVMQGRSEDYVRVESRNAFGDPIESNSDNEIIDVKLTKISQMTCAEFSALNPNNNVSGVTAYFDDIRIHPYNGNMKSFVYDPHTQRLMAELDENNYATFYEYDQEGGLIRVKKETEKGVYTIQETRSSSAKNGNATPVLEN